MVPPKVGALAAVCKTPQLHASLPATTPVIPSVMGLPVAPLLEKPVSVGELPRFDHSWSITSQTVTGVAPLVQVGDTVAKPPEQLAQV